MPNKIGGWYIINPPPIKIIIKYIEYYLGVSNIILIFVLSVRVSRRVQPTVGVAEGRLQPAL
jgi:hypothetical protein